MPDAMVTARMSPYKKEQGNLVLERLGTNASQAVNRLYDYLIEKQALPFEEEKPRTRVTKEQLREAMAWVESLKMPPGDNRFANMSLKEVKYERLKARGLYDGWCVE